MKPYDMNLVNRSKSKGGGPLDKGDNVGVSLAGFSFMSSISTPSEAMKALVFAAIGRVAERVR